MTESEIDAEVKAANKADGGTAYRLREGAGNEVVDAGEAQKVIDNLKLPENVKFVYAADPGKIPMRLLKEMAKNPLLLATVSGTLFNILGGSLPEVMIHLFTRMGSASIALGLLMVGAGLKLQGLSESRGISTYFILIKLIVLPAIALALSIAFALPPLQMQIAVMFCALPTASSAYVLAARMGGNAPLVAFLISAGTLLSIFTLPMWLLLAA